MTGAACQAKHATKEVLDGERLSGTAECGLQPFARFLFECGAGHKRMAWVCEEDQPVPGNTVCYLCLVAGREALMSATLMAYA